MPAKSISTEEQNLVVAPEAGPKLGLQWQLIILLLLALATGLGFWLGAQRDPVPDEDAVEVGFARDMATHHAQAVDLSTLLRERSEDPELRQLALDIMLTQQAQIGQMQGWLTVWGRPLATVAPAMGWMGMPVTGLMPGMASATDVNRLRTLSGGEADGLFLQLMIIHHRAGVAMARAVLERTDRAVVRALAQSMVNGQENEIAYMQELRQRKGLPPVSDAPAMDHANMSH